MSMDEVKQYLEKKRAKEAIEEVLKTDDDLHKPNRVLNPNEIKTVSAPTFDAEEFYRGE